MRQVEEDYDCAACDLNGCCVCDICNRCGATEPNCNCKAPVELAPAGVRRGEQKSLRIPVVGKVG